MEFGIRNQEIKIFMDLGISCLREFRDLGIKIFMGIGITRFGDLGI